MPVEDRLNLFGSRDSTSYMQITLHDLYLFQSYSKLAIFNSITSDFNIWIYSNTQKTPEKY